MMKNEARKLLFFSFVSFLFVFIFGLIRTMGPFKALLGQPGAYENVMLFHSHFDQLCWLGAAAIGTVFLAFGDHYQGSQHAVKYFAHAYIEGTLIFSLAFLVRAVGYMANIAILRNVVFTVMVSLGGVYFLVLLACGVIIARGLHRSVLRPLPEQPGQNM